jgi:hypothetical protein
MFSLFVRGEQRGQRADAVLRQSGTVSAMDYNLGGVTSIGRDAPERARNICGHTTPR